jgi:hypothetical protein
MPYIKSNDGRRETLQYGDIANSAGELNYQIFYYVKYCLANNLSPLYSSIKCYVDNFLGGTPNYQAYNDMTGALIRCTKEIKRRLYIETNLLIEIMESYDKEINDYEDLKITENGDV